MKGFSARRGRVCLLLLSGSFSAAASAQTGQEVEAESPPATQAAAEASNEVAPSGIASGEIVVTAQRRSQALQDVPMSVNVATGDQLEKLALQDFKDVQQLAPGLEMNNNDGRRNVATIRGITYEPDSAASPAVDIYFNDIPVDAQTVFGAIYDVAQIEVLRGPQGIFRGRTSPAGAITLTTRRANLSEPEGYFQVTGTDRNAINVQGAVSVPLIQDKLALRFAALGDFTRSNQVRSIPLGNRQSNSETMSGRVSLAFQPTESFRAWLTYQHFWTEASPFTAIFGPGNTPFAAFGDMTPTGPAITLDDRQTLIRSRPYFENNTDIVTLATELDVTDTILWSVNAGYQHTVLDQNYPTLATEVSTGVPQASFLVLSPKTLTVDTRFSSDSPGPFNWMLGGFYQRFRSRTPFGFDNFFFFGSPFGPFPLTDDLFGTTVPNPLPAEGILDIPGNNSTRAVFGSVRYDVTDALQIEAGLRYTHYRYHNEVRQAFCVPACGDPIPFGPQIYPPNVSRRTHEALTGGATISYEFSPDFTMYAAYGHSYRPPTAQNAAALGGTTNLDLLLAGRERADSFEIGAKGNLFDRRLSFALDVFFQKYRGYIDYFPALNTRSAQGGFEEITTSTNGDAISKGIEAQLNGRPTDNFDFGLSASYIEANYDNAMLPCNLFNPDGSIFIPAGEEFATCTRNDRIAQVPRFSASLNGEHRFPVGNVTPFIRGLVNYRPGFNSTFDNFDYRSFTNVTAFLGVRGPDERWEISAFARNLLDQTRALRVSQTQLQQGTIDLADFFGGVITPTAPILSGYRSAVITNPREFGLSARFSW